MRSRTARRVIFAVAIAGTIWAILAGPMLALRWMEGSLPLSPWNTSAADRTAEAPHALDLPHDSYAFTWGSRSGAHPAPALRMRIAPTEWHGWWKPDAGAIALAGDTPAHLTLEVLVPDGEAVPPALLGNLCDGHPAEPGACRLGRAKVEVLREAHDQIDIVLGRRAPAADTRRSPEGRTMATRYTFWTQVDTADGRRRFLGWACEGGPEGLPLTAGSGAGPEALFRCHEPGGLWERALPGVAGNERSNLVYDCDASDRCRLLFDFHGRLVVLTIEGNGQERGVEATRLRLFLAAWAMLNRQHADALYPRGAIAELPDAKTQLVACQAVVAAAVGADPDRARTLSDAERQRFAHAAVPCRRAADIASRLARSAPAEAASILSEALPALARIAAPDAREQALHESWVVAVQTSDGEGSVRMAEALAGLLARAPGIPRGEPGFAAREVQLLHARTLLTGAGAPLPDDTCERLVAGLVRQYRATDRENDAIAILEEHVEAVARMHGPVSPLLGPALVRLGNAQHDRENFIALRRTTEHLLAVWQAPASAAGVAAQGGWSPEQEGEIGVALVLYHHSLALHDGSPGRATAVVATVIDRLVARLGATHPFVRAAQRQQREAPAGRAVSGAPVGAGALPAR